MRCLIFKLDALTFECAGLLLLQCFPLCGTQRFRLYRLRDAHRRGFIEARLCQFAGGPGKNFRLASDGQLCLDRRAGLRLLFSQCHLCLFGSGNGTCLDFVRSLRCLSRGSLNCESPCVGILGLLFGRSRARQRMQFRLCALERGGLRLLHRFNACGGAGGGILLGCGTLAFNAAQLFLDSGTLGCRQRAGLRQLAALFKARLSLKCRRVRILFDAQSLLCSRDGLLFNGDSGCQ